VFDAVAITRSITWCILIILEIVVLIGAVRAYRAKRSRAFCFLLCACIFYIMARTFWFTFGVVTDVFSLTIGLSERTALWQFVTQRTFDTLFLIFLILALVSFIREQRISN
jgi:hypothetical protein